MKKIPFILTLAILLLAGMNLSAAPVSRTEAEKIAISWYRHIAGSSSTDYAVQDVYPYSLDGMTTFYTFTFLSGGFVIVAADDASIPILGYSESNPFPAEVTCPATKDWLDSYSEQIAFLAAENISNRETLPRWDAIRQGEFVPEGKEVEPLLTTQWSQGCYYNELCPADPAGPCGHVVTGCVATAMAQLMKYHNHPPQGVGEHCYPCPNYGTLCADFGSTVYDWESMPDQVTGSNLAVATLMYHAGVSVHMIFGANGSGAYGELVPDALAEYFNYDPRLELHHMADFPDPEVWKAMLRADLDQSLPVYYLGANTSEGHAFICDGYRTSDGMFHFNWGWSGNYDGYYAIGALNTPWGSFNLDNIAIIGVRPLNPDLVVRILSPYDNYVLKAGEEITIEASTVYGSSELMRLTIDGEEVASGSSGGLTYTWQTTADDTASHEVIAWAIQGVDTTWYAINLNVSECWIQQASAFQTLMMGITSISAVDSMIAWAVARDGVFEWGTPCQEFTRTVDGGDQWTAGLINNCDGLGPGMIFAIDALRAYIPMFRYYGPNPQGIYMTTDGGATWNRQATAAYSHAMSFPDVVHFFNENEGWCMGDPIPITGAMEFEMYTTADGGENWIAVPAANIPNSTSEEYGILTYSAVHDTLWFGTTKGRVYRSTDKGYNWTVAPVPDMAGEWITPVFRNGSHGLVQNFFMWDAYEFEGFICESFDGGQTWTKINQEGPLYWTDLAYIPGTENKWISTGGRIMHECGASVSSDGGHTWTDIPGTYGTKFRYMDWLSEGLGWAGGYNLNDSVGGMFKFEKEFLVAIKSIDKENHLRVYPNPCSDKAEIRLTLDRPEKVTLKLYDITGREVRTLVNGELAAGEQSILMDADGLQCGIYLLRLTANGLRQTECRKLVVQ